MFDDGNNLVLNIFIDFLVYIIFIFGIIGKLKGVMVE